MNSGQFRKGNPGKQKGTISKKSKEWEALGKFITGGEAKRFKEEMAKLNGKDFINSYMQVLEYFQPKLQRTENKHEHEGGINVIIKK